MSNLKKRFCSKGHDTFICGRGKDRACIQCKKENHPLKVGQPRKQFCLRGHDTFVTGRYQSNGQCVQCQRDVNNTIEKREQHKKYVLEHRKEITEKNRKRSKAWKLLKKYNLTLEDYNKMLQKQNNLCLGCNKSQNEFKNPLSVDHNHNTGKIRGLLCQPCNLILGNAQDNIQTLLNLIKYLKKWNL